MKAYIVRKIYWEYQDYSNIYDICDEKPFRVFLNHEDSISACELLNQEERKFWEESKPDSHGDLPQTYAGEPMDKQIYFEVVEMEIDE